MQIIILDNKKNNLEKFDTKADEGIFIGYSMPSKAFRVFNKRNLIIESIQVTFDETNPKRLELKVITCACILKKTNLKENDQAEQDQSRNQVIDEEPIKDQNIDTPFDHQDLPK